MSARWPGARSIGVRATWHRPPPCLVPPKAHRRSQDTPGGVPARPLGSGRAGPLPRPAPAGRPAGSAALAVGPARLGSRRQASAPSNGPLVGYTSRRCTWQARGMREGSLGYGRGAERRRAGGKTHPLACRYNSPSRQSEAATEPPAFGLFVPRACARRPAAIPSSVLRTGHGKGAGRVRPPHPLSGWWGADR